MTDVSAPATITFAPSELVVLFGDRFTPEAGMLGSKEEVLTSGIKVNSEKLMSAAVGAAVWAAHRAGAIRLELRQGKALFGLIKTQKLHVVPGTGASPFPAHSLESIVVDAARTSPELQKLLEAFIGGEVMDVPAHVLGRIKAGMAERGLLGREERKTMMVFTTVGFTLPDATKAAAGRESLDAVQSLLRDAEQREPALAKAVRDDIDGARVMMTESRD
ncbi:hypothetical protein [Longimicrobium sp.]|uniref:hypothetical protein n=1 Tax=Longimicrobium sp. TaxID=2029185 RepID=UPI002E2F0E28|nr:hypothetical protein [Longimicrobium sp.]HEX6039575.1 hypothetical protein [Longimicrobium sp.]